MSDPAAARRRRGPGGPSWASGWVYGLGFRV